MNLYQLLNYYREMIKEGKSRKECDRYLDEVLDGNQDQREYMIRSISNCINDEGDFIKGEK